MDEKQHITFREFELHDKYMKDSLTEIKTNISSAFNKLNDKLDDLPQKFVTKDEFHPVKDDVKAMKDTLKSVIYTIVITLISWVIGLGGYIWHLIIK